MGEKASMTPEEIRDMEHQHVKMSYNKIEDLLYAGNNLCCVTHFEHELLSKGIAADISLEIENLDNPSFVVQSGCFFLISLMMCSSVCFI